MEQMNFHKQKLYALIAAGVGVISCFLPWWSFSFGGFGLGGYSVNGMHGLGILVFLGFIGAGVVSFLGDKTKPFEGTPEELIKNKESHTAAFLQLELN